MSILQERHPDAVRNTCVAIIGGDPWADDLDAEMARLQQLRRDLGIHDLVTFLGAKDQDVLPYYYAAPRWSSCRLITRVSAWWRWKRWRWARR